MGPKTISEIKNETGFLDVMNKLLFHKFFKDFNNYRIITKERAIVFSHGLLPNFFRHKDADESNTIWKTKFF